MSNNELRRNFVVVYKDTPERIIHERILGCFTEMCDIPPFLILETPNESSPEISISMREQILKKAPINKSVWVRREDGEFVIVAEMSGSTGDELLAQYYQSELLKRVESLVTAIQMYGVKHYEVAAKEEQSVVVEKRIDNVREANVGVAEVCANNKEEKKESFAQKLSRSFVFSRERCRNAVEIDIDKINDYIVNSGLQNVHVLKTIDNACREGEAVWPGLEFEESLSSDLCAEITATANAVRQIIVGMAKHSIAGKCNMAGSEISSTKLIQDLSIKVSNK